MATTTAGEAAGSCRLPNTCQRSAVRISIDRPWIRSNAGETETAAQTSTIDAIAIASRVVRPMLKIASPARPLFQPKLLQAYQASDDRCRAGFGLRIDAEHNLRGSEGRSIRSTGRERAIGAGEIVEAALELGTGDLDLLTRAPDVEPFDPQRAAARGL